MVGELSCGGNGRKRWEEFGDTVGEDVKLYSSFREAFGAFSASAGCDAVDSHGMEMK